MNIILIQRHNLTLKLPADSSVAAFLFRSTRTTLAIFIIDTHKWVAPMIRLFANVFTNVWQQMTPIITKERQPVQVS